MCVCVCVCVCFSSFYFFSFLLHFGGTAKTVDSDQTAPSTLFAVYLFCLSILNEKLVFKIFKKRSKQFRANMEI